MVIISCDWNARKKIIIKYSMHAVHMVSFELSSDSLNFEVYEVKS